MFSKEIVCIVTQTYSVFKSHIVFQDIQSYKSIDVSKLKPTFKMNNNDATEIREKSCKEHMCFDESDILWNEGRQKLNSATPSVIRRGLCMVRNQGKAQ